MPNLSPYLQIQKGYPFSIKVKWMHPTGIFNWRKTSVTPAAQIEVEQDQSKYLTSNSRIYINNNDLGSVADAHRGEFDISAVGSYDEDTMTTPVTLTGLDQSVSAPLLGTLRNIRAPLDSDSTSLISVVVELRSGKTSDSDLLASSESISGIPLIGVSISGATITITIAEGPTDNLIVGRAYLSMRLASRPFAGPLRGAVYDGDRLIAILKLSESSKPVFPSGGWIPVKITEPLVDDD